MSAYNSRDRARGEGQNGEAPDNRDRRKTGSGGGRGGGYALGPGGNCVCPACGNIVVHEQGVPCYETMCPNCGAAMIRQR